MPPTVILGLGNPLRGDDGAGLLAMEALRTRSPRQDCRFVDGGTLSFPLTEVLGEAARLIVIDAARFDAPAGTVRVFVDEAMDDFVARHPCSSVHEVGLAELLDMVRLLDALPAPRALIGIRPRSVDWSPVPSPEVAAAIPRACEQARTLLAAWQ